MARIKSIVRKTSSGKAVRSLNETEVIRMEVAVKDLLPNPYRKMERYKLQPERLNALVKSIRDTDFWDNILARPNPDGSKTYQIAYGHHRLQAVRTCGIKKVNIPVKALSDILMVKIMANENQNDWHMDTSVMNQTIWAVQDFIRDEVLAGRNPLPTKLKRKRLSEIKLGSPVGIVALMEFLGKAWETRIKTALELRKLDKSGEEGDKEILEAAQEIKTPSVAREFARTAKKFHIPKSKLKPLAKQIQEQKKSTKETFKTVLGAIPKQKTAPGRDRLLAEIEGMMDIVDKNARALYSSIWRLDQKLGLLEVKELGGFKALFTLETFARLLKQVKGYLEYFGYTPQDALEGGKKNAKQ